MAEHPVAGQPVARQPVLETPLAEPGGPFVLDPRLSRAIRFFGGRVVHPNGFAASVPGLQAYLRASGVRHFSAEELVTPYHPEIAARFGIDLLLPPRRWWQRGAALALIGEDLRHVIDEPIRVRNWWRPPGYNAAVGGDPRGDHPTAHGVDFDYNSPIYRYRAEQRLLQLYTGEPWLELSLGLGPMTAHVGLLSPRGCRLWLYPGHPDHGGRAWRLEETSYHCRGD